MVRGWGSSTLGVSDRDRVSAWVRARVRVKVKVRAGVRDSARVGIDSGSGSG